MTADTALELLADLAPVRDDELAGAARTDDARALLDRITARPVARSPRARRRWLALPVAAAVAVAAVVVALSVGGDGTPSAAAATLRRVAGVAQNQDALIPGPGQFIYTKSVNAFMSTTVPTGGADAAYSVIVPRIRQVWLGPGGGRLYTTSGTPRFVTPRDRERWVADGSPSLVEAPSTDALSPTAPLDLPADPDALWSLLEHEAQGNSNGTAAEMFTLVGDALRETAATPAQRAALYEVAARIDGVQLVGQVHDSAGRAGTAVSLDAHGVRFTLVLDPDTSSLLEEREVALPGNPYGYPAGLRTGWATYLVQAVVGSDTSTTPVRAGRG